MRRFIRLGAARFVAVTAIAAAIVLATSGLAHAGVDRIQITSVQSPTFGGTSFGTVGQYEKVRGTITGAVDPTDPRNAGITDIALAPRNAQGKVEYTVSFLMLRPLDLSKGNHRVLYEPANRGFVLALGQLIDSPAAGFTEAANDPTTAADAGNGFLMRQGYTFVAFGWDALVAPGASRLLATVPVATNPDGSPIVGPATEEIIFDNSTTVTAPLSYPAGSLDESQATLTMRVHYLDSPVVVPASGWDYANAGGTAIKLTPAPPFAANFQQSALYEFTYRATKPLVVGLGLAAARDLADFLGHAATDRFGNPNPLAGDVQESYATCVSGPCRFLRDFVRLGFNRTEPGGRAFDGILNWIGGASGGFFNYRFAVPARTMRQHIGRWVPERQFPFADQVTTDVVTGATDGVLRSCLASGTCPKIFEVNSDNEYWVKAGSLLTTDTLGNDLADPANVRNYLFAGAPHTSASGPGICQQPRNPLLPNPGLRALLVNLDQWVSSGTAPPNGEVPRRADGTLVPALPQSGVGFPAIPGVTYNGLTTTGDLFDFGPQFGQGILTTLPPAITASVYPVFVPKTDADGNGIAGVRLPDIAAPLATYSGWNLRGAAFAGNDLCDAQGQRIPFAQTKAARLASGDPRLSVAERYPSHQAYVNAVTQAANQLHDSRFLLADDVQAVVNAAAASNVAVDATQPVLTVPADITTGAPGPGGTAVTFSATATDNWDTNPVVSCVPASGSTFAVGTTTVACTATDATGNAANGSFTVHVDNLVADLHVLIGGFGLDKGLGKKLNKSVSRAEQGVAKGHSTHACKNLGRVILTAIDNAGGHGLSYAEALELVGASNAAGALLGCHAAMSPSPAAAGDLVDLIATIDGMGLKTGEANELSGKARAVADRLVEGEQKESCHKLDVLAGTIAHDTGRKDKLTAAQGSLLSAQVAAIGAELGC